MKLVTNSYPSINHGMQEENKLTHTYIIHFSHNFISFVLNILSAYDFEFSILFLL